jgi:thiopeptide-type bacteriocin biosynthesis protein
MTAPARYAPLGAVLVRAPALPVEAYLALPAELPAADEPVAPADPLVRAALSIASPDLLDRLDRVHAGTGAARAAGALLRYRIRMSTRPTPFGLFAGVGLAELGERTELRLGEGPLRTRMRPDMGWLLAFVARLEERLEVRRELRVMTNPSAWLHGGRVLLAQRAAVDGSGESGHVDIRATGVVRRALALARRPIAWRELAAELAAASATSDERVEGLLTDLWRETFLITELRPPLTHRSPAHYVKQRLEGIGAARAEHATLAALLAAMEAWDASDPGERPAAGRALSARAARAVPTLDGTPAQVDAVLPLDGGRIGRRVADAAARAVELLLRLGPSSATGGLDGYRRAFSSRYGTDREVALLELLDPERGLGPPAGFGGAADPAEAAAAARRHARLRQMAIDALRDRRLVVRLDEETVRQLTAAGPPPERAPISVDLSIFVLAGSAAELDRGDVRLLIGPNLGAQAAGRNLGRFADLLDPIGTQALRLIAGATRERQPERLHAELVYLPRRARAANVAVRPALHDNEVIVTTMPGVEPHRAIPLSELLVGLSGTRFYVRWPHAPGDLVVHAGHMLNPRGAPEACRFLEEVARDERAPLSGFAWGPAGDLPFLPRVEVGSVVLAPARWRIDALARDERLAPEAERFDDLLASWRADWMVPERVYLAAGDNRLLLDLASPAQAAQLRDELRRVRPGDVVVLQEPLPGPEHAWLEGPDGRYLPELIVSLIQRHRPASPAPHQPAGRTASARVRRDDRLRMPGSDWLFAKLYGPVGGQDELLAGPVRTFAEFATASGLAEQWFFVRYADPEPHLRLRFAGDPDDLVGGVLPRLCRWAQELLADGLCDRLAFDTYEREIERYGGLAGMAAAERIFAIDSATVVELVDLARRNRIGLDRAALAVLSIDALLAALGLDERRRLALYRRAVSSRHEAGADYRHRQRTIRSLVATHEAGQDDPDGALARLIGARAAELEGPAQRLAELAAGGELAKPIDDICQSFVHMHCNRLLSRPAPTEQHVLGLALRAREGLERAPLRRGS